MLKPNTEQLDELESLLRLCEVQAVRSGAPLPLGAHMRGNGVNFAIFSRHATGVRLDLFVRAEDATPARSIILDAARNKTGDIWHVWLEGIRPGQLYGFRIAGPYRLPWTSTVIYELHVRGFTIDPRAGVQPPGTYRGLIQKIPYLKDLGVTAVELMPVQEFNEHDSLRINPKTGERLRNFWGYDPLNFFAPKASYASVRDEGAQVLEFKERVRAFHREGLEVILDVVFNHTGEGDELGPTLSFRGIDNSIYYWLADDKRFYLNFTGTGQTVNASHPVIRDLILDALRYWVMEMHVDGFRFDLASVLGRDVRGRVLTDCATSGAHCRGSDPPRRQAHCRSLGCRGRVSGRLLFPAPMGGVEWPFPRRCAAVLARGRGHDGPLRQPHLRQFRFVRGIEWFDPAGRSPDWLDPDTDPVSFVLPELAHAGHWRLTIDTAQPSAEESDATERDMDVVSGHLYAVSSRSCAILVGASNLARPSVLTLPAS